MNQFKYLFPIAVIKSEQLKEMGIKIPPGIPYFELRVPTAFNPLLIDKNEPDAKAIAKGWEDDGVRTELV